MVDEKKIGSSEQIYKRILLYAAIAFFFVILVRTAWIAEDAYITFRTMDNFVNGYGLRWNIIERVQSFTHPLWLMLLTPFYFITQEAYFTVLFISIITSLAAIWLFATKTSKSAYTAIIGITILTCSKAFTDYSTSGLENPLTHLILIGFFYVFFTKKHSLQSLTLLSFIASLGTLNRMDTLLLYAPTLIYVYFKIYKKSGHLKSLDKVVFGFTPFIVWELFSLLYYGFLFPNTYYAKMNNGIPSIDLIQQGLLYLQNSLNWDPITLFTIILSGLLVIITKKRNLFPLAIGMGLYLLYTVKVGGDFMSGRFLTAPLLMSVIIFARGLELKREHLTIIPFILFLGLITPYSPLLANETYGEKNNEDTIYIPENGIADERGFFYQGTGLLNFAREKNWPDYSWARNAEKIREDIREEVKVGLLVNDAAGMYGYFSGPDITILDRHALTDPLLARLPAKQSDVAWEKVTGLSTWRIGHFRRYVPKGYIDTYITKNNQIEDPNLATYYSKLHSIISDPLMDTTRLSHIIKMNLGSYDYLLENLNEDTFTAPRLNEERN